MGRMGHMFIILCPIGRNRPILSHSKIKTGLGHGFLLIQVLEFTSWIDYSLYTVSQ